MLKHTRLVRMPQANCTVLYFKAPFDTSTIILSHLGSGVGSATVPFLRATMKGAQTCSFNLVKVFRLG